MAEYIVHNIDLSVTPLIRTSPLIENDKPVERKEMNFHDLEKEVED